MEPRNPAEELLCSLVGRTIFSVEVTDDDELILCLDDGREAILAGDDLSIFVTSMDGFTEQ